MKSERTITAGPFYQGYALACLTLVYMMQFSDRVLMVLALEPIRQDMNLSDTQLGFLTGFAFSIFYATAGLPIARLADRGNRVTIASLAMGLWGIAVMGHVLVTNFAQLVVARIAAAIGEAGCLPPTYSLVGDYFPRPGTRARAMSVFLLASPLASLVVFALGGWLIADYGWRTAFLLTGVPGLIVALIARLTLREPRHRSTQAPPAPPFRAVAAVLWQRRTLRHMTAGLFLLYMMGYGLSPWYAAFMLRSHGLEGADLGFWFAIIFGFSGVLGILAGGYISGKWLPDNPKLQLRISAVMVAGLYPFFLLFLLSASAELALLYLFLSLIAWSFFFGPVFALLQRLVASDMRATALALVMLLNNLIGMGVGPQIVGLLSDALTPAYGEDALRYAMLGMCSIALWSGWHLWRSGRSVDQDLAITEPAATAEPGGR